jgi:hypothetical protein
MDLKSAIFSTHNLKISDIDWLFLPTTNFGDWQSAVEKKSKREYRHP